MQGPLSVQENAMKAVVQRVKKCAVSVNGEPVSGIAEGFLVFLGIRREDGIQDAEYLAEKICQLILLR